MPEVSEKAIGSMNGPWAILLKILLTTYPFLIMWSAWVTKNVYSFNAFANAGDRFSLQDAYALERRIDQSLDQVAPSDELLVVEREISILREENRKLQLYIADKISDFKDEITKDFIRKDEHVPHN